MYPHDASEQAAAESHKLTSGHDERLTPAANPAGQTQQTVQPGVQGPSPQLSTPTTSTNPAGQTPSINLDHIQQLLSTYVPRSEPSNAPSEGQLAISGPKEANPKPKAAVSDPPTADENNLKPANTFLKANLNKRDQLLRAPKTSVVHWMGWKDPPGSEKKEDGESDGVGDRVRARRWDDR